MAHFHMQIYAWRKPLDVEQSINSRNLVALHTTLTLTPPSFRACFKVLSLPIAFLLKTGCFLQLRGRTVGAICEQWASGSRGLVIAWF